MIRRSLALAAGIVLFGCAGAPARTRPPFPGDHDTARQGQVDAVLDRLYQSFNYAAGQEPDWVAMRSLFFDDAVFVPEPEPGRAPVPRSIDDLIARWQAAWRGSADREAYAEWITQRRVTVRGNVAYVEIEFMGRAPTDDRARQPGIDHVLLLEADGQWKVAAFVVARESRP